ncbi:MAG: GNAT family N-acetyltransferase [Gemmatimonadaceae bacterium]|nr:GNAT family N-acetyltransferase [Gemmatimonadaceae bacterium]
MIETARLLLRPWHLDDADALAPLLEANHAYVRDWIPASASTPVAAPLLRERLARYADDFAAKRAWRYALFTRDTHELIGELTLFPRTFASRGELADADRIEIGYWLREAAAGNGYITEACTAALELARAYPQCQCVEIRVDVRNTRSAAVSQRLGFALADTVQQPVSAPSNGSITLQVWRLALSITSTHPTANRQPTA